MKTLKQIAALQNKLFSILVESGEIKLYTGALASITKPVNLPDGTYSKVLLKIGDLPETDTEQEPIPEPDKIFTPLKKFPLHLFSELSRFSGNDEIRPQLMGVFYDAENKKIVSTNAHVLRFESVDLGGVSFILPAENIKELVKLSKISEIVDFSLIQTETETCPERAQVAFADGTIYNCPLCDGKYPNYMNAIPKYETGYKIKISKQTLSEMMQFSKDIAATTRSALMFQQAFINIDTNTATIENIDYKLSKSWQIETEAAECPDICGLVMPVMVESRGAANYFGINMYYLNNTNAGELFYNTPTRALLIPAKNQTEPEPTKKQVEPEPDRPKVIICSVPKYEFKQEPEPIETEQEPADEYPEPEPIKPTPTKAIGETKQEPKPETAERSIKVVDYSDKAIAVIGDTKPIKEELKAAGGRFNAHLKCGAGWIFSKKKTDIVNGIIK